MLNNKVKVIIIEHVMKMPESSKWLIGDVKSYSGTK